MPNPTQQGAPVDLGSTLKRAMAAHQNGQLDAAETLYRTVLDSDPHQFDALQMLGIVEAQRGRPEEARKLISRALKANPKSAEAHANMGRVLKELGLPDQALESFEKALTLNPLLIIALSNRGVVLNELGRHEEALASYERALALAPNNVDIILNRGNALRRLRRSAEALAAFDEAISYHPGYHDARIARANILHDMQRYADALEELDRVLVAQPQNAMALTNRGTTLHALGREDDALESFNAAVAAAPKYAQSYHNRGNLFMLRRLYRHAAADFATALQLDGNVKYALGNFIYCRMQTCDWAGLDEARQALAEDVRAGRLAAVPLVLVGADPSPAGQLACARAYVADRCSPAGDPPARRSRHDRLRVAYVSGDLREHTVALSAAGLFERHDRNRFETTAISLSPEEPGPMLDRLTRGFDRFLTVADKSDDEIVRMMRDLEIDIAVDLMGHTRGARTGILARRAAPIQVNFLGFAGTTGADYIDYIIADEFVIPEEQRKFYSEQPVYLPDTAQVGDGDQGSAAAPTRAEVGLPETGVVYCAFNSSYKFTPQLFEIWMRLLRDVEGSTLWVLGDDIVAENLRREAAALGVAPDRLVFAPQMRPADHVARSALADVFLDTLPANGGATTRDMLWAGVPVVTCAGEAMISRMAGGLLRAIGLPELITESLADYEALAREFGRDTERLARTKVKLKANRATHPLFDTERFTRHLERAYSTMWERHERGEPPAPIKVVPLS